MNPIMIRASISRVGYRTNYPPLRLTWGDRNHKLCMVLTKFAIAVIGTIALFMVSFTIYAIVTPKEELKENIIKILHEE